VVCGGFGKSVSTRSARVCGLQMSAVEVVNEKYPLSKKHKAPVISFEGNSGLRIEMKKIEAFTEEVESTESLFSYDNGKFQPVKPKDMGIAWPSGDGRQVKMTGTKGSFTQPNLKEYGPFPDYFKRSCDL